MTKVDSNIIKPSLSILLIRVLMVMVVVGLCVAILLLVVENISFSRHQVQTIPSKISKQAEKELAFEARGYSFSSPNIIVDPYDNSPLTALIAFETDKAVAPAVTIIGKDELSTFSHTFPSSKVHYLPVYGLYAGQVTDVKLQVGQETKLIQIETGPLPPTVAIPKSLMAKQEKLTNELYFFTPSSTGKTTAYDVNGDVRWYLNDSATWEIGRLKNGHLLMSTERLINPPYYTTGLYEMDLLGKIYKEYSLPGGYHHDYVELDNGNFLIASDDFISPHGTVEDVIVEVDSKTGNIVKEWDIKNILNTSDGQMEDWSAYDWFHNNSVWYDKPTNSITLSGRHKDAVINIDYESGKLNWIIGDKTNWDPEFHKYFFTPVGDFEWQWAQHAAMITPEGYVFILDNGNNKSKNKAQYVPASQSYTRGVLYQINTTDMTIKQLWQYGKERGSGFYSPYISDVDYLGPGHYLVHSGGISYKDGQVQNVPAGVVKADTLLSDTVEILNDEVVYEIKLPTNNYRVEKMPIYAPNEHFSPVGAQQLGSLGQTPINKTKYGFIKQAKPAGDFIKEHNIKTIKEYDRLVFSGQFKQGDKLKLILTQGIKQLEYNIRVSKKPYTALCVDIFTEEEKSQGIEVTKYINAEGLRGKYSLYVELNGVVYKLDQYIRF